MCCRRHLSTACLAAWLALGLTATASAAAERASVGAIELRSDVPVARAAELLDWVTVEVGRPLDSEAVARSLRNLHAAGVASQIEAYSEQRGGALTVSFVMHGKTLVEDVKFQGSLGLDRRRLEEVVVVGRGEPLLADRIFRSVYALNDLYEAEGFFAASVRVSVDEDEARRRATVSFDIEAGEPALVTKVSFDGDLGELEAAARSEVLRLRVGGRYRKKTERDDRERLETWLLHKGYRLTRVTPAPIERASPTEVAVTFAVELGPHFVVDAPEGLDKRLAKRELLPLSGFERYDESTAAESARRIRTFYQIRGHYDCQVQVEERVEEAVHHLAVAVEPGPRHTLTAVRFTGNESLSSQRLQGVMQIAPRSLLSPDSGALVDEWLSEDLAAIRALYALEGYFEAQVGPPVVDREGQGLELEIPIVEGSRRTVLAVELHGVERFDNDEILAGLPLQPGGPYHARRLDESLDVIRGRYESAGYNQAQVSPTVEWSAGETVAAITINVLEGPQNVVERVIVRGLQKTRPEVMRNVLDLDRGEPVNQKRLIDVQRRLYGLGVFSRVDVRLVPGTPYSGGRDVMVDVSEGKRQRLTYGTGYDSEDGLRGLLGYSHGNLWGRAVSGRVDARASQRDEQIRMLLRQPYVGRLHWPVTYSLFQTDSREESFRSERRGAQVEVLRTRPRSRWGLLYTYKIVQITDADPGLELLQIDRNLQEVTVASLTPSLFLDRRDDAIDPQRGWNATILTEYAFPVFKADEEFVKVFLQHAKYVPLGRAGVLVANWRLGAIEPLAGNPVPDPICVELGLDSPTCQIKISERFFAGGRTTHRAFRRDRLGIPGSTLLDLDGGLTPIGGTGEFLANIDYRVPLGAGVGGTLFVDGGNIWPDWRDIELGDLRWGAGLGLRYSSPIGPIRLEIGWNLDRLPGEDGYVVFFSFGNPF
jgi:outer membrane protein insertion porin family